MYHQRCRKIGGWKCIFHVFNFICLVSGVANMALSLWNLIWKKHYLEMHRIQSVVYTFLTFVHFPIGALIFISNIIGYVAVWKEHRHAILYYISLLVAICVIEILIGLCSIIYNDIVRDHLALALNHAVVHGYQVDTKQTQAMEYFQQRHRCCGSEDFHDWHRSEWSKTASEYKMLVPESCCRTPAVYCGRRTHPSNIFQRGCLDAVTNESQQYLVTMLHVATATFISHLTCAVISALLCILLDKVSEYY